MKILAILAYGVGGLLLDKGEKRLLSNTGCRYCHQTRVIGRFYR